MQIKNNLTGFTRDVLTLLSGATIAQAIPVIISPFLTRIYSPEDFGIFALYMSVVSIVSILATGRYEMAIVLSDNKEEVKAVIRLILILVVSMSSFTLLNVLFFKEEIAEALGHPEISSFLYLVPISLFLYSGYQILTSLLIRKKKFSVFATSKVVAAVTSGGTKLAGGFLGGNAFGLVLGNMLGRAATIYLIIKNKSVLPYFNKTSISIKEVGRKYKKFPQYDVPAVTVNVLANQLPFLALGKFFDLNILGFYSQTYNVLMLPISLLAQSILDVFKQRATEDYHKYGNCKVLFVQTLKRLLLLGLAPFLFLGAFAPSIFSVVFGSEWAIAGRFAQIMTPMFFLNFIVSPLSYTFFIAQKQNINLVGQTMLLLLSVISIVTGIKLNNEYVLITMFTISYSVIYIAYLVKSYQFSLGTST